MKQKRFDVILLGTECDVRPLNWTNTLMKMRVHIRKDINKENLKYKCLKEQYPYSQQET